MSSSISSLFPVAQRQVLTVQHQLSTYESGETITQDDELSIHNTLSSIARQCSEMDLAANNEGSRREMWKQRVSSLNDEVFALRTAFTRAQSRNPHSSFSIASSAAATRSELFERSSSSSARSALAGADSFVRQDESLGRSHTAIDELTSMGSTALESLRNQRITLKNAHRKAMDMANTMGLSNSIMKLIGKEEGNNAIIVYAGMVLTITIVGLVWYYVVRR